MSQSSDRRGRAMVGRAGVKKHDVDPIIGRSRRKGCGVLSVSRENDLRWWMRTSFAFGTARLLPIGSPSPSCETNAPSRCPGNWGFMFTPRLKRSSALLRSRSRNITAPGS